MVPRQRAGSGQAARPDRDLVIDLARFFCLALVVVSHTMMVSPVLHPDGTVTSDNTLGNQRWFEPVVWVLQVMPLFFVAGGITGLQSWRRLRARGGNAFDFMQARMLRLIRPAAVLLAIMFTGLWAARLTGVDPQVIQLLVSGAGMPLWFLAAYLAAQLNLPLLARLHARAPWLTLAGLTVAGGGGGLPARDDADPGLPQHGLPVVRRAAARILPRRRRPAGPRPPRAGGHHPRQATCSWGCSCGWGCTPGTCW